MKFGVGRRGYLQNTNPVCTTPCHMRVFMLTHVQKRDAQEFAATQFVLLRPREKNKYLSIGRE